MQPHTFCSFCGTRFPENLGWPRTCPSCHYTTYCNPLPVAVVLVPVDGGGLLLIRRTVEPQAGKLALPGGYINLGETWQEAGTREVAEETGVRLDSATIQEFGVRSAADGTVLIFGLSDPAKRAEVNAFRPSTETSECQIISAPVPSTETSECQIISAPVDGMAFPFHAEAVCTYFKRQANTGPN